MKQRIFRVVDKIAEQSATCSGYIVGLMMLIICYEIFFRYLLNRPTTFAYDVTEYLIVYSTFMAAPWLLKTKVHVHVTILTEHLSSRTQVFLEMVTSILGFAVCVVMCIESIVDVWELIRDNVWIIRPLSIPKFITRLPIPYSTFLLAIYFLEIVHDSFIKLKRERPSREACEISSGS